MTGPRPALPTVAQVLALGSSYELVVPSAFTDGNGHMNIARYTEIHSDGGWRWFEQFGLGEAVAAAGGASSFDVEHHARYLREVREGHTVVHCGRLLGRSERAVHSMQFIVNRTTGELANTLECVALSVDLTQRRVAAFPPEIAAALDVELERGKALDWVAPVCGVMTV